MKPIAIRKRNLNDCKFVICNLKFTIGRLSILLASMTPCTAAFALVPHPPTIVAVRVGLADRYKVGLWTQVEVTLRGGSQALAGQLSVVVPDGDGVPSRVFT
jgi:hypothetical protein